LRGQTLFGIGNNVFGGATYLFAWNSLIVSMCHFENNTAQAGPDNFNYMEMGRACGGAVVIEGKLIAKNSLTIQYLYWQQSHRWWCF